MLGRSEREWWIAMEVPSTTQRRTVRRRRQPKEARDEALASARRLLLERGPDAITLKAVAEDLGMTHTNLLHHFGSAAELQTALMTAMVRDLGAALQDAIQELKAGQPTPAQIRALVDKMFDAFDEGGAGRLAAWLALSKRAGRLEAVEDSVADLVTAIEGKFPRGAHDDRRAVSSAVLVLTLCAFADSLAGDALSAMLHRDRKTARKAVADLLPLLFRL